MENEYDDIDKLFQEQLGDNAEMDRAWNDPGDDPFLAAMDQMDEPKKERRPFIWWWTGLGAGALLIISFFVFNQFNNFETRISSLENSIPSPSEKNTNEQLNSSINESTEQIENVSENTFTTNNESETRFAKIAESSSTVLAGKPVATSPTSSNSKSALSGTIASEKIFQKSLTQNTPSTIAEENLKATNIARTSSYKNISGAAFLELLENQFIPMPFLPMVELKNFPWSSNHVINNNEVEDISETTNKKKNPWRVFAQVTAHNSSFGMKNIDLGEGSLTKYDRAYLGRSIKIGADIPLSSNFILRNSLGLQHLENQSLYKKEIVFDENQVTNQGGLQKNYLTTIVIADPMGKTTESFDAVIMKDIMNDADIMKQKSHIHSEFYIIQANVTPSWKHAINNKWMATVGLGLDANFVLSGNRTVETDLYKKTEIVMADKVTTTSKLEYNTINLGIAPQLGLNYQINSNFDIGLTASYHHGITSLNKMTSTSVGKTFIRDYNAGIQLGYTFK